MARRNYVERLELPSSWRWDEWEGVLEFGLSRTGTPEWSYFQADWSGGSVTADSFAELRQHAEGEKKVYLHACVKGSGVKFSLMTTVGSNRALVLVESETEDIALGAAAALRRRIEEGILRPTPPSTPPSTPTWRRVLQAPNPWALIIVGTVLATLIVAWVQGSS